MTDNIFYIFFSVVVILIIIIVYSRRGENKPKTKANEEKQKSGDLVKSEIEQYNRIKDSVSTFNVEKALNEVGFQEDFENDLQTVTNWINSYEEVNFEISLAELIFLRFQLGLVSYENNIEMLENLNKLTHMRNFKPREDELGASMIYESRKSYTEQFNRIKDTVSAFTVEKVQQPEFMENLENDSQTVQEWINSYEDNSETSFPELIFLRVQLGLILSDDSIFMHSYVHNLTRDFTDFKPKKDELGASLIYSLREKDKAGEFHWSAGAYKL